MFEPESESTGERVSTKRIALPLSDEVRASLAAVRIGQESARRRLRRETWSARIALAAMVTAVVLGGLIFGPRVRRRYQAARDIDAAPAATGVQAIAAASSGPPTHPPQSLTGPPTSEPVVAVAGTASISESPVDPIAALANERACADSFSQRRWRLAIEKCTLTFQQRPGDGALALRIAQAYVGRGRLTEATPWAKRAIGLDPVLAEAFVIVARADAHDSPSGSAASITAYRRYLALAPHGWHASEARSAVRAYERADRHLRSRAHRPSSAQSAVAAGPSLAATE